MMRFLGVLVGSALAVAALVVFVGIPEFTTESSVPEPTVITLPMRADAPDPVAEEGPDEPPPPAAIDTPAQTPAEQLAEQLAEQPAAAPAEPLQWYAFWSPFRSEVAANGFVDQLQRVTGLDYRVVKVKPGVYEVAFAYEDDQEITANLTQISAATGLQLPES
jgi:hypothetical protein